MPMNKKTAPLLAGLQNYIEEEVLRFHMPGHFGMQPPEYEDFQKHLFGLDVTEVEGTDNLAEPEGIIRDSLDRIGRIYGAKKSFFLVNGSTSGLHIAIDSLVPDEGRVLVARNAHKSIHHILKKKNITPRYLYPEIDEDFQVDAQISLEELESTDLSGLDAVILTCPNYYGRAYDLEAIHRLLQEKNIPLLVDAAHGAHFEFSKDLPPSAVRHSDVCIMSLHKTMPAFTQCSLLHLGHYLPEHLVGNIEENLRIYQTSSPSYLLMGSAELSVAIMDQRGRQELERIQKLSEAAKEKLRQNPKIRVYESDDFCKIFIQTPLEGETLAKILRKDYKIQGEMTLGRGILFMLGIGHTEQQIDRLVQSLSDALKNHLPEDSERNPSLELKASMFPRLEAIPMARQKALKAQKYIPGHQQWVRELETEKALGQIVAEDIIPYPPGIPIIKEFEILNEAAIQTLKKFGYAAVKCYDLKMLKD